MATETMHDTSDAPHTDAFNIAVEKSVLNVDAQKELMTHSARVGFKYAMLTMLVMFVFIGCVVAGVLYMVLGR
jgi:hypothetical protein